MAATAGNLFVALTKVPEVIVPSAFFTAPSLRGKNSYQAPESARSRSARIGYFSVDP